MTLNINNKKPELLLPVGKTESLYAAIEGGANAVYLGLKQFNARQRAANFSIAQLQTILNITKKNDVKVYITLNTLIKNWELKELLQTLFLLNQLNIDAIIIQDWSIPYFVQKYFHDLNIHASTQMANHNSAGAEFSKSAGFERVIFARELTMQEIQTIRAKSDIGLEIFAHGALCYSFSGMCLFSSYLGGASANRGQCAQPCRRLYSADGKNHFLFSLKDNQLIDYIPQMIKMGIDSVKIEGRMKSAEYVYTVAKAYRMAIDHPERIEEAKALLTLDMGREKTDYFWGSQVKQAITKNPTTGYKLGKVTALDEDGFSFQSGLEIKKGYRLRVDAPDDTTREVLKVDRFNQHNDTVQIFGDLGKISLGDNVFLAGHQEKRFSSKLPNGPTHHLKNLSNQQIQTWLSEIQLGSGQKKKSSLYIRIHSLAWLKKIHLNTVDGIFFHFTKKDLQEIKKDAPFIQKNLNKIWIELPKFIPEKQLNEYRLLLQEFRKAGFNQFILSHLCQKLLLPKNSRFGTNENVYCLNDAAITFIKSEGTTIHIYPYENVFENLKTGKDRNGIVPLFFYPDLFTSRMPVQLNNEQKRFKNDQNMNFNLLIRDGITHVLPERPVALFQHRKKLEQLGFHQFLLDMGHEKPSKNIIQKLMNRYQTGTQYQPSTLFNFKEGLK